uniref:Uncharacterized protein n=1 Tax=Brassica oleracea var. oleracea TaxID=109376 RepID=A0A0D3DV01_BRAOL
MNNISKLFGCGGSSNPENSVVETYVSRKLHRTSASRFGIGIGIGTLWKLKESRFQNASNIFFLKTRWNLMISFWNRASVL